MKKTISTLGSAELIAHINEQLDIYKAERDTVYKQVTLKDLQAFSKSLQLSVLLQNPEGIALKQELDEILKEEGNILWGVQPQKGQVKSLFELNKEQETQFGYFKV